MFIDRGTPVEYELVRSLCTVSQQKRKRVGVLKTDAQLYGGFNMQAMSMSANWPIIDELEKQYEVVQIDPSKPITTKCDVLLAVQPSSLGPEEMDNFVAAVAAGQPTAIFEDPAPVFCNVAATSAPRQPPGGMNPMMMRMQSPPKGDINKLWRLLGVSFSNDSVVWQDYNPYPKASPFPPEFVFIDKGCGARRPFGLDDSISAGLQHMLFPFPGFIDKLNVAETTFVPLARTGQETGTVLYREIMQTTPFGPRGGLNPERQQIPTGRSYVLAAHIQGKAAANDPADEVPEKAKDTERKGEKKEKQANEKAKEKPRRSTINVVLAADIDMLSPDFFRLREQGDVPEMGIHFDFDNVTFVLNALDELAGDRRFLDIRKRRPEHRTLTRIDQRTKQARQAALDARQQFINKFDAQQKKEQQVIEDKIAELKQQKNVDPQTLLIQVAMMQQDLQRQKDTKIEQLRQEKDREINKSETELNLQIKRVQDQYKLWAVLLPPIPPLLVAMMVFFSRRAREREGVARSRLR